MSLLPDARFDDIRLALDPMLDDEAIPSTTIASAMYLGRAESWAVSRDPLGSTRTGVEQEAFYQAIIFYTAALLSQVVPQSRQVNLAGHGATFTFAETAGERTTRLAGAADAAIASYIESSVDVLADAPIFVTTVSGQRG
jgi:hypothetical protein